VAALSNRLGCGLSLAGIVGSNPTGGMNSVSCECCVSLRRGVLLRADHSFRRVLMSVVRLCVIVKPR
jgi:hypothetical protein